MKILTTSNVIEIPLVFDIEIYTDHPVLNLPGSNCSDVSASKQDLKDRLPNGRLISKEKNRITQQMIDEFEAFTERIEDLCEDEYGLVLTYRNVSDDHSYYYNYLVKDEEGKLIARFRIRLRISNHNAHRTEQQKKNKKEETKTDIIKQLLSQQQINKMRPYPILVEVNDSEFESYEDAFDHIDERLQRAIEIVRR